MIAINELSADDFTELNVNDSIISSSGLPTGLNEVFHDLSPGRYTQHISVYAPSGPLEIIKIYATGTMCNYASPTIVTQMTGPI